MRDGGMMRVPAKLRPRLLGSALLAALVFGMLPAEWMVNSRLLVSWDVGVVCYLSIAWTIALGSSTTLMQDRAAQEDEGAIAVLILTMAAAVASLAAIAVELKGIHDDPAGQQVFRLSVAAITILCSWFFVHTIFAIHYAHEYYGDAGERQGLKFPHEGKPDYWDFLYFAFNLGAAAQTSDVIILSRRMRRLALAHTILSFLFNTTILALAVNVGAGLL
ncbi:putative membrane protein [Microvirga subterranea]|uniref:Putative membrane protein n=2 Tax=Microvirga subterranea TaxID=186651 RepID=A0A370HYQ2_9HYPH|nr:putative membrane protein [Microvirga subterranea]